MNPLLQLLGLDGSRQVAQVLEFSWRGTEAVGNGLLYVVIALGILAAGINFLPNLSIRTSVRVWTAVIRVALLGVLLFVLHRVELDVTLELAQKQAWKVVVDDSASMAASDTTGQARYAAAQQDVATVRERLEDSVALSVESLSGGALAATPGNGPTKIDDGIRRAVLAAGRVDRLLLLTDGRDSDDRDLEVLGQDLKRAGVQTTIVTYGTAVPPQDRGLSAEPEQAAVRLGEEIRIRGVIWQQGGEAADNEVVLTENGKEVKRVTIPVAEQDQFVVHHKPAKSGKHSYTLAVSGSDNVASNNRVTFTVDVVDEKIKVLMIEGYPRFEYKLFKANLEVDPMIDLVAVCHIPGGGIYVQGEVQHRNPEQGLITSMSELFKYDVIILRDVSRQFFMAGGDRSESRLKNIVQFVEKRGGGLMVTGGQDVYLAGGYQDSALAPILPFDLSDAHGKKAQFPGRFYVGYPKSAYRHPILRLLTDPVANKERLRSLQELDGSNNVGRFKPMATPLMMRTLADGSAGGDGDGNDIDVPVMGYMAVGDGKVLATAVDTSWRWQLQPDFDDPPLQAMLANTVRFLAPPVHDKPSRANVSIHDSSAQVGQRLLLSTTLKDKNYDPIQQADVVVTVTRPDGSTLRMYPQDLPENPGVYEYAVDVEQVGAYGVTAQYGKSIYETGFHAGAAAGEYTDLSVDHERMDILAKAASGERIESLAAWLEGVDVSPASERVRRNVQAWNSPLVLTLFILLVSLDCYLRKRQGLA